MGRVLVCLGRAAEALDYLDRAEKLSPRDMNAYARDLYRAGANLQLGDYEAAATASENSLAGNNNWNMAWVAYALALAGLNRTDKAIEAMQTARNLDSENLKEHVVTVLAITAAGNKTKQLELEEYFERIWVTP